MPELVHLATRMHPTHGQTWAVFASYEPPDRMAAEFAETFSRALLPECTRAVVSAYLAAHAPGLGTDGLPSLATLLDQRPPPYAPDPGRWWHVRSIETAPGAAVLPLGAPPAPVVVAWESFIVPVHNPVHDRVSEGEWIITMNDRMDAIGADGWEHVATSDGFAYFKRPARKAAP